MDQTTKSNKTNTFRNLLQSITCDRFADKSAAYAAIDQAFQNGTVTEPQRRQLSAAVRG